MLILRRSRLRASALPPLTCALLALGCPPDPPPPPCGGQGQPCCAASPRCADSFVCNGDGRCDAPCPADSPVLCPYPSNPECAGCWPDGWDCGQRVTACADGTCAGCPAGYAYDCASARCRANGAACGGSGQPCCSPNPACEGELTCLEGVCGEGCGGRGQACCATSPPCAGSLACQSGRCEEVLSGCDGCYVYETCLARGGRSYCAHGVPCSSLGPSDPGGCAGNCCHFLRDPSSGPPGPAECASPAACGSVPVEPLCINAGGARPSSPCSRDADCCSNYCKGGFCESLHKRGDACTAADYCEGYCRTGTCACDPEGAPCDELWPATSQCCSFQCRNGRCTSDGLRTRGTPCTENRWCLGALCLNGRCGGAADPQPHCQSYEGYTVNGPCCSGVGSGGLCTCIERGGPCTRDQNCCDLRCLPNGTCD